MRDRTRATDADREACVSQLEAAYVTGQLSGEERDDRVGRALQARTVGELRALVADLQTAGEPTGKTHHTPPRPSRSQARALLPLVLAVVVVLVCVLGARLLFAPTSSPRPPVAVDTSATPTATPPPWRPTAAALKEFRAAYERKFGSGEFYEMWINDDNIFVNVPTRDSRNREEGWHWEGSFSLYREARARTQDFARSDVADLNINRLVANRRVAVRTLGVRGGTWDGYYVGSGQVLIHVRNTYDERGALFTTLDGTITDRSVHEG